MILLVIEQKRFIFYLELHYGLQVSQLYGMDLYSVYLPDLWLKYSSSMLLSNSVMVSEMPRANLFEFDWTILLHSDGVMYWVTY